MEGEVINLSHSRKITAECDGITNFITFTHNTNSGWPQEYNFHLKTLRAVVDLDSVKYSVVH